MNERYTVVTDRNVYSKEFSSLEEAKETVYQAVEGGEYWQECYIIDEQTQKHYHPKFILEWD